jgi:hypothetical protein
LFGLTRARLFNFRTIKFLIMKKLIIPFLFLLTIACDDDESPSNLQLLTNGSSKGWVMTLAASTDEECGSPQADRVKDNTWTFFADGKFMFDGGAITESGDCGDMRNTTGTWEFLENETVLKVFAAYDTDDPEYEINMTLFVGTIKTLTETTLVIEVDGEEGTFTAK